jgi:hypothetical protein
VKRLFASCRITAALTCSTVLLIRGVFTMPRLLPALLLLPALALGACTNPYDPGQRAVGGAAIGAGTGALVGSVSGNAGAGAVIGGAVGALAGAATTPQPYYEPAPQAYYQPAPQTYYQPAPQAYYAPPPRPAYAGWYDRWGRFHRGPPPRRGYYRY